MRFEDEINKFESTLYEENFIIKKGTVPILFSVPHGIK